MDSQYIIQRLKSTLYKYPTVDLLRTRLQNIDEYSREKIISSLKKEVQKERNMDIRQPLHELLFRSPSAY
ncbi:hypothetical protein [Flavobacterium sp.]